jgi:hypothetical protein
MNLFQSILPSSGGDTPANMQGVSTPPNIMALLQGLPITAAQAQQASRLTPNVVTTPGTGAPSLSPPPAAPPTPPLAGVNAALTALMRQRAAAGNLPDPTQTGVQAGADAAANTRAESNPLNTLLISLANGVRSGVPAFRATKQANAEAAQSAAVAANDAKVHRDYINSPDAAKVFGSQIGAARALSDSELGPFLVKNSIVQQPEYSQNQNGDVVQVKGQGVTGQPIYRGQARAINPGQQVPRFTRDANGVQRQVLDGNGQPVYDTPNPLPTPKPAALTAAQQKENTIRNIAGLGPNDPITDDNREAYQKAVAWVDAQARTPRAMPAPRSGRLVQTEQGIVSVDPITHEVTPLTDQNGAPLRHEKTAAMVKAQSDSALVAKVTGSTGATPSNDNTARDAARTATAKAILNGTQPGDKATAQAWLKLHP